MAPMIDERELAPMQNGIEGPRPVRSSRIAAPHWKQCHVQRQIGHGHSRPGPSEYLAPSLVIAVALVLRPTMKPVMLCRKISGVPSRSQSCMNRVALLDAG